MSQQFIIKLNEQGPQGAQGERGETGATGNGINYIDKTSTAGIVDTYTIYYTNGNTSTFEVTNGNSIDTIEKTSTVGIVDTYTITMVDGSTHTFTVTNGTSISSIEKTSTVGLTDTYTITLTNGDTSTFTVTNGNGIASINKTATSGLTDTYTITFTNGSTMDFDIKNGKSIVSVTGPTTLGLVDTYTINFNDNTSSTFNVTNGNGITNIEKTGSTGLIDTYTINMSNGSYKTFTVTNGEKGDKGDIGVGVVGITKTSTSGLEDTYTMSYTDGSSSTFVVTNGNGIESIELLSTEGLTNNYRINFDNGTYFDYSLDNAKSIISISKVMTSGLVDTYRITFNDGSSFQFPVTNGNGVSGVTLLSWEGLDKTYRMTFTNGTYFDFVVSNGAEGQAEWGGISGVLSNQHDLQDALDAKAEVSQTHALKSYSDNGELLTDAEGLADVTNYAHSTFDLSKFTVTGSPNITSDGVASGFSNSNYLTISLSSLLPTVINNVTMEGELTYISQAGTSTIVGGSGSNNTPRIYVSNDGKLGFYLYDGSIAHNPTINLSSIQDGDKVKFTVTFSNENITASATINNGTPITISNDKTLTVNFVTALATLSIGHFGSSYSTCPINLKQFSITVDGVEVFSGNKTGIDTIKPDDYTVVGTPTISADGVLNTSSGNYLTKDLSILNGKTDIVFYTPIATILSAPSGNTGLWGNTRRSGEFQIESWLQSNGNVYTAIYKGNQGADQIMRVHSDGLIGHTIQYMIIYKNNEWAIYHSIDGGEFTQYGLTVAVGTNPAIDNTSILFNSLYPWGIGVDSSTGGEPLSTYGSIDLNSFKIYVDGSLVYQPCLKIPYTESKTGSKIVDAIYRDRVNDMASQFGYANYYTIDEENQNFTLPQVELYGLIGDKTLRDSYYNGVTYWELFSNRRLEQGGSCESGVEYTLPKPFADANYVLTIPYSSKTATSFIPSATGDFIAKGTGLL